MTDSCHYLFFDTLLALKRAGFNQVGIKRCSLGSLRAFHSNRHWLYIVVCPYSRSLVPELGDPLRCTKADDICEKHANLTCLRPVEGLNALFCICRLPLRGWHWGLEKTRERTFLSGYNPWNCPRHIACLSRVLVGTINVFQQTYTSSPSLSNALASSPSARQTLRNLEHKTWWPPTSLIYILKLHVLIGDKSRTRKVHTLVIITLEYFINKMNRIYRWNTINECKQTEKLPQL